MTDYEQVGKFIFGVHRLDFELQLLCHFFAGNAAIASETEQDPALKLVQRTALADAYFAANHTDPVLVDKFKRIASSVHTLEVQCHAPDKNGYAALDQALADLRDTQQALAELTQAFKPGI
ncbi:hypothetical protein [Massilia sp. CF038]|uniref:hypothetical protein n=1 Tax=Massilia sp. CF038 TaxID=1881045 RepID=UPI000932D77D|nr:hypothetical protein [Massilia sp. CF038]